VLDKQLRVASGVVWLPLPPFVADASVRRSRVALSDAGLSSAAVCTDRQSGC
jgi:hypothetical protein